MQYIDHDCHCKFVYHFLRHVYNYTQVSSVIFVDSPVGTGFSYSRTMQRSHTRDTKSSDSIYECLRNVKHHLQPPSNLFKFSMYKFLFPLKINPFMPIIWQTGYEFLDLYLMRVSIRSTTISVSVFGLVIQWLLSHPIFIANPLYIAGDSYSGRVVLVIVQRISEGNDKQLNRSF